MAEHELVGLLVAHIGNVELLLLTADEGIEHHMLHDVAQLLHHLMVILLDEGVGQFEYLLDGVGSQTLQGLLAVPGALLAQTVLHIEQSPEGAPADGLVRAWPAPDTGIDTHRIYMVQWYSFAVLAVGLWAWFHWHRPHAGGGRR